MSNANGISSFFILLLLLLYITHSLKINNLKCILFCSTLLVYFRIENAVYLIIFLLFLLINKIKNLKLLDLIMAYIFFLPNTAVLKVLNFPNEAYWGDLFLKLVHFYEIFHETFSGYFLLLFLIGIFYFIKKKKWESLLVFFVLFFFYFYLRILYPLDEPRQIFSLVPIMVVFIIMGFYSIYNFTNYPVRNKILWKISLVFLFCGILFFNVPHHFFTKFDMDPGHVIPYIQTGELLHGEKLILYGNLALITAFKRFYKNYIILNDPELLDIKQYNINSFDYVVHFGQWPSNQSQVEKATNLDIELIYDYNYSFVHVYKVVH